MSSILGKLAMKKEARGGSDLPSPRKSKSDKKAEGKRKDAKKGKSKGGCHGGVRPFRPYQRATPRFGFPFI